MNIYSALYGGLTLLSSPMPSGLASLRSQDPIQAIFNHTGLNVLPATSWTQRAWGRLSPTPAGLDIPHSPPFCPRSTLGTGSRRGQSTDPIQCHHPASSLHSLHIPLPPLPPPNRKLVSPHSSSCLSAINIARTSAIFGLSL